MGPAPPFFTAIKCFLDAGAVIFIGPVLQLRKIFFYFIANNKNLETWNRIVTMF
jgi:hypothetical protein